MSFYNSIKKNAAVQCKALTITATAALLAASASVMAQSLPTMPPSGYDQSGRFAAGSVNDVYYYSSVAGKDLKMVVYTPPGYNTNEKYGVVYAYQGIDTGPDVIYAPWGASAGIVADNLIGEGKISKGVIIVAVDDQFNGAWNSDVRAMTLNDAIPYIDSHYSTYADADHRALYGFSWGGGYAFNVGCASLDTFHHISPSSAAPNKAGDETLFPNGGAEAKQKLKTLLISCGDSDWLGLYPASLNCHNYCDANGIPNYWWGVAGGNHDGGVWRAAMWNFIQLADRNGISRGNTPPTGGVTFYQDFNYGGASSQALGAGSYTISQLANKGMPNDWASSVRVPAGYTVIMYENGDFTGSYWTLTADTPNFGSISANDKVSSVVVELNVTGTKKIVARHSGKAIDAYGAHTDNGTQLIQWNYGGGTNQQWTVTDLGGGEYSIIGVQSGKSIDISNWGTDNGSKVQLWDYFGGTNQKFYITPTDGGYYRITPTHAPNSCLDVEEISTADGAKVHLWTWLGGQNQQWAFQAP